MAGNVRLTGMLICASEIESALVRDFLPLHMHLTRQEAGCLAFDVVQTENPLIWSVDELFVDQSAFEDHQTRTKASEWFRQTAAIRREYQIISADRS